MNRRALLVTTALLPIAACANLKNAWASVTPAQIVSGVNAMVGGLARGFALVPAGLIPAGPSAQIAGYLGRASAVVKGLTDGLPATNGAGIVVQVEGYVNDVLNVCAAPPLNALIPSPFNLAVAAAAVVLPTFEAFVNQYLPATVSAPLVSARAKLKAAAPQIITYDQGIAVLQDIAKR